MCCPFITTSFRTPDEAFHFSFLFGREGKNKNTNCHLFPTVPRIQAQTGELPTPRRTSHFILQYNIQILRLRGCRCCHASRAQVRQRVNPLTILGSYHMNQAQQTGSWETTRSTTTWQHTHIRTHDDRFHLTQALGSRCPSQLIIEVFPSRGEM
jgi:hypothetical protein